MSGVARKKAGGAGALAGSGRGPSTGSRPRIVANKNRPLQYAPVARRKLFDAGRRGVFLEWFAGTANLSLSARAAGVHYRTVLRHRATDAGFQEAFDIALAQGLVRVKAWLLEVEALEGEAWLSAGSPEEDEAALDALCPSTAPVNMTPEMALQLLRDDGQRERYRGGRCTCGGCTCGGGGGGGGGGARGGRPVSVASIEEVRASLVKRLRAFFVRVRAEDVGEGPEAGR